jgi:hemerythrin
VGELLTDITVKDLKEFIEKGEKELGESFLDFQVDFMFEHFFDRDVEKGTIIQFQYPLKDMARSSKQMIVIGPEQD